VEVVEEEAELCFFMSAAQLEPVDFFVLVVVEDEEEEEDDDNFLFFPFLPELCRFFLSLIFRRVNGLSFVPRRSNCVMSAGQDDWWLGVFSHHIYFP